MDNKTLVIGGVAVVALFLVMSRGGGGVRSLGPLPVDPSVAERERARWQFATQGFTAIAGAWSNVQRSAYDNASRKAFAEAQRQASLAQSDASKYVARQQAKGRSGFKIGFGDFGFDFKF